jgi:hypothetical protein
MVRRRTSRLINKKVIYPVFLRCAEFTLDRFYIDILSNCARADFPKGVKVSRGFMYIDIGKSKFKTIDLSIEPRELYSLIILHFKSDLNLCSSHETKKILETYDSLFRRYTKQKNNSWSGWSNQMKCDGITNYVHRMSNEKSLSSVQCIQLFTTINSGILFKCIRPADIHCKKGKIVHISGIYSEQGEYIYKPRSYKEPATPTKKQVTLMVLWATYINSVLKKYKDLRKS